MPRLLSLAILALALTTALRGQAPAPAPIHNHPGMGAAADLGATAVFDTKGVLWAAHKQDGCVVVRRSEDRGHSWFEPIKLTPSPEATDTGGDARPKIALGQAGELYVTWTKSLSQPYTGEIRFARSLDGGKTFSASSVVHHDRQEITHRFDTLAVNSKGQVFVAWIDKRDLVAAPDAKSYRGAAIYFAVSDDRGASFRGDFKLVDHACECCRIALAPRPDGTVAAFWRHIFEPNLRDHALATLRPDGTASAVTRATFEDWRIDACPHHGPSVALDATGRVHAVWFSAAPNTRGAFYGRLGDGKPEAVRPLTGDLPGHADLAVLGSRLALAWKTFSDNRTRIRAALSTDGGATWREEELASTAGPADHPQLLTHHGRFYLFWNTRDEPLGLIPLP
jgi:hypothetical protein